MALELPALPFALVESNIFEEVAARAQTEQDVQRSRMLDPEYLVLLGQSVLADLRRRYLHVLGLTRRRRSGRRLLPQLAIRCSRLGDIPVR